MTDKQILADLYEVLSSQQRLLSFILANHQALLDTLVNESALVGFVDRFQDRHEYTSKHPKGQLFEALSLMQRKLDAIGETLKRDRGAGPN